MMRTRITDFNNMDIDHMHAEALNEAMWTHPDSYGGHSPEGDIVLSCITRDSDARERSNWICIRKAIEATGIEIAIDYNENEPDAVYDFRAGHWAYGWVEYLMVPQTASRELIELAGEILCALSEYSIFNEEHCSELETKESQGYWQQMSVSDRIDAIKSYAREVSIFAARRDYIPDNNGSLDQYLASW